MQLDVAFLSPDHYRYKKAPTKKHIPKLTICADGRFLFNLAAHEMLSLRPRMHVLMGASKEDGREWYLRLSADEGFLLLKSLHNGRDRFSIKSQPLRKAILDSLPHAPRTGSLHFALGEMPVTGPDDEAIWPLMTAPYWQPQPTEEQEATAQKEALRTAAVEELGSMPPVYGLHRVLKTVTF